MWSVYREVVQSVGLKSCINGPTPEDPGVSDSSLPKVAR